MVSNLKRFFSSALPYAVWFFVSVALLAGAYFADPYIFGFCSLGAAALSGALVVGALLFALKRLPWAALSAAPTLFAMLVLSTFRWA
jgi:hypothetical protein